MDTLRVPRAPAWYGAYWAGRLSAVVLIGLWVVFALREGPPQSPEFCPEIWTQFAALAAMFVGYVVGLRNALWGGVLGLVSLAAYYLLTFWQAGFWPNPGLAVFAAPSVLYLVAFALHRRHAWEI